MTTDRMFAFDLDFSRIERGVYAVRQQGQALGTARLTKEYGWVLDQGEGHVVAVFGKTLAQLNGNLGHLVGLGIVRPIA
jgi:hypothetical protein